MRTKDDPYIKGPANCCATEDKLQCAVPWEKWCRGCNLVYCTPHQEPEKHACRSLVVPVQTNPPEKPKDVEPVTPKPVQKTARRK